MSYFYIFLQSNLLEFPIYYFFLRKYCSTPFWTALFLVTLMNSLSHPIVFFGIMGLKFNYLTVILLAEFFAIISEAVFMKTVLRLNTKNSFIASLLANIFSWQMAPVLTYLIWLAKN